VRFHQIILAAWLALICTIATAFAEKRVALVIGNDHYANLSANEQLQKAVNDAHAVGGALRRIGFDVIEGENLGRQALIDRLDEAAQRVQPGDTVFFFFSGHGVSAEGVNYILPADVPMVGTGQITRLTGAAVREDDITAAFKRAGARVAVVILDACRNNPFATPGTKASAANGACSRTSRPAASSRFIPPAAARRRWTGSTTATAIRTRCSRACCCRR
jgi:uncharacterized caspase-like protein